MINRRLFVGALGTSPLWIHAAGCASKPETPLAHLYGQQWVHGAYELYAKKYVGVQTASEEASTNAYKILAQKGIVALDALQSRNVPFFVRVDETAQGFSIERNVPSRLMFTANMSQADRDEATKNWEAAREHIHTDYEEIRRLNWALTTLLQQLQSVRGAIENGHTEQFQLVRQLASLEEGGKPPYELPFQVSNGDYSNVLTLLLERLEDDRKRLARLEADIVTVSLTARATDAGSGSLAANIQKVLLAVVADSSESKPRAAQFPADEREAYLAKGKALYQSIKASPEYIEWEKKERTKAFEQLGAFIAVFDSVSPLKVSAIYQQVIGVLRGDADYLSYLKMAAKMLPFGKEVVGVVNQAIDLTDKTRKVVSTAQQAAGNAKDAIDIVKRVQNGEAVKGIDPKASGAGLLNLGSDFALKKLDKQIAFFKDKDELSKVSDMLGGTNLVKSALPDVPKAPAGSSE